MRTQMVRHRDISLIFLVASTSVIAYSLFGVLVLRGEADGKLFANTPKAVAVEANLQQ